MSAAATLRTLAAKAATAARSASRAFTAPVRDVRSAAFRVAVIATAIVCVAYLVIAAAVMMMVTRDLTSAVDSRLQDRLNQYVGAPMRQVPNRPGSFDATDMSLQEPLLSWIVVDNGQIISGDRYTLHESLPDSARAISSPSTVTLADGTVMRAEGIVVHLEGTNHDARLVVGQSLANLSVTQHNILTAELLIGSLLLLAVFFGAYTVGRRVGSPFERARQRQVALTADASHELRTPLSVIEAQTSLALERDRDPEWYRRAFEAVGVESKRMRKLVDDLLWLARFDATRANPGSQPVDLGVLADQAASRFAAVAESRGQTLRVSVESVSTVIGAPPEWLDRLLGVLLDNACRYTPAGGLIDVAVSRRDGRVRLAVEDSGPGIAAHERTRIFERFHRASDLPGGSGLGLSIATAVVGASGGRWDIGTSASGGASMAVSWTPLLRGSGSADHPPPVETLVAPRPVDQGVRAERPSFGGGLAGQPPV